MTAPNRRLGRLILALPALLVSAGCSNPWAQHYRAGGEPSAAAGTQGPGPVRLIEKPASTIAMADPPGGEGGEGGEGGLVELGVSRFELDARAGTEGLRSLARQVGAVEVWWAVELLESRVSTSTARIPSYDRSRTTGYVTQPDGSRRAVDLTTTTTRWEDVPVTTTTTRYWHVARFFGLTAPTTDR